MLQGLPWPKYLKSQVDLERIKISVIVEQEVVTFNAKCRDQAVDRVAYRKPSTPQYSKVVRRRNRQLPAPNLKEFVVGKNSLNFSKLSIRSNTLQNLAQPKTRDPSPIRLRLLVQPVRLTCSFRTQKIDQH